MRDTAARRGSVWCSPLSQQTAAPMLALGLSNWVNLGELLNLPVPQSPYL